MKFKIDVELSGTIEVEAEDAEEAIKITENLSTYELVDVMLNLKTEIIG